MQLIDVGAVGEPGVVPIVDPVKVGRVVQPVVSCNYISRVDLVPAFTRFTLAWRDISFLGTYGESRD